MKRNKLQIQWNNAAERWVDFVRTGKDHSRDEMNNPAMFEMLGDIKGKKILDIGCGEGYNTRIIAKQGAKVIGIDFSKVMVDFAIQKEKKERLGIDYYTLNACNLHPFCNNSFDIVTCFMTLQDIDDYQLAIKEAGRVIKKHGRFILVIPHPCFEKRIMKGKTIGGWEYKKGTKVKSPNTALYYKVDRYFDNHKYIIPWKMKRLKRYFKTTAFHRTLMDYVDALHNAGFVITRLKEPKPTKEGIKKYPNYFAGNLRIPNSMVIEAVK